MYANNRQLNVLKRIGGHLCKLGKLNVYYSLIMSNFNYCLQTWHFVEKNTKRSRKYKKGPFSLSNAVSVTFLK